MCEQRIRLPLAKQWRRAREKGWSNGRHLVCDQILGYSMNQTKKIRVRQKKRKKTKGKNRFKKKINLNNSTKCLFQPVDLDDPDLKEQAGNKYSERTKLYIQPNFIIYNYLKFYLIY